MELKNLAEKIYEVSHLTGEFKLRSGQISNEYFDKYQFECRPEILKEIAKAMKPMIPKGTEILGGLEMGGIPLATALSFETGLPTVLVRKEAKQYGTSKLAEGPDIKGKRMCLIEDVITTGGQVAESTEDLRKLGALVDDVLCVIYRGQNQGKEPKLEDLKLNVKWLLDKQQFDTWFKK